MKYSRYIKTTNEDSKKTYMNIWKNTNEEIEKPQTKKMKTHK
tara:strand:- start:32 stop:157 length:126 start_codon:yes stop_codon:yes gene_type:complete